MRVPLLVPALAVSLSLWGAADARAFQKEGCGSGECAECHTLTRAEAAALLGGRVDNVLRVVPSPMKGLWQVDAEAGGRKVPVYIDYSKRYMMRGSPVRLDGADALPPAVNPPHVDVSGIPLSDALLVGDPSARTRLIVFSDPDCRFCARYHEEIRKVVARDPRIAFHIKVFPHGNSPVTYRKALSIVCGKSVNLLEDSYAGKEIPPPTCKTAAVEDTIRLVHRLRIASTPATVLPDGRVVYGFQEADTLLRLVAERKR